MKSLALNKVGKLFGRRLFLIPAIIILACAIAAVIFFKFASPGKFQVEYKVSVNSVNDKTLKVNIRLKQSTPFIVNKKFELAEGALQIGEPKCTDNSNKTVNFEDNDGIISIKPERFKSKYIDFSYAVPIGYNGKSGIQGAIYDDLLVFSGEQALMLPYFDTAKDIKINEYVSKVSIQADVNKEWNSVMPYQQGAKASAEIDNPDWSAFYNLSQSCYAFGKFTEFTIKNKAGDLKILADGAAKDAMPKDTSDAISSLYNYYVGLFGGGLDNYPVVFLRQDPSSKSKINGGVGGESFGITFDASSGSDWKAFSHSLYTAFFDSRVKAKTLHFPPNLWLYKGLATYYENASLDALPDTVKDKFGFNSAEGLRELYARYIYNRIKDPGLYKLSPADESSALGAQQEFFYYTEAPLVIKTINDITRQSTGNSDVLLQNILQKYSKADTIEIGTLMTDVVGTNESVIRDFLSGDKLMTYPGEIAGQESPTQVLTQLNDYQSLLYSWLSAELPGYPESKIDLLDAKKVMAEVDKRGLKFAKDDEEKLVAAFSPTVYFLLKQYALQADVCGEKDLTDPMVKYRLAAEVNVSKWLDFSKNLEVTVDNKEDTNK